MKLCKIPEYNQYQIQVNFTTEKALWGAVYFHNETNLRAQTQPTPPVYYTNPENPGKVVKIRKWAKI